MEKSALQTNPEKSDGLLSAVGADGDGTSSRFEAKMYQVILQLIGLATAVWITYLARPGTSLFSWHPSLMAFSFLVFMPAAIFAYSRGHPVFGRWSRSAKNTVHWVCHVLALGAAIAGAATIIVNKESNGWPHFTSRHGLFGIIAVTASIGGAAGGFFALNNQLVKAFMKPVQIKSIHAIAGGAVAYPLAMVALFLATYSSWFVGTVPVAYMRYTVATVPVVLGFAVFLQTRARFMGASPKGQD